jgi:hypothetical protein
MYPPKKSQPNDQIFIPPYNHQGSEILVAIKLSRNSYPRGYTFQHGVCPNQGLTVNSDLKKRTVVSGGLWLSHPSTAGVHEKKKGQL